MTRCSLGQKADAVIFNPQANAGNGAHRWRAFLESDIAREAGLRDASAFDGSLGMGQLEAWVSDRIKAGARRFVAAGGDGTVHLALNALMNTPERTELPRGELKLGAVGLGSSNDFQKPFGAEGRHEAAGLRCRLDFAQASPHDVGQVQTDQGERYFILNASVGVTAEANWSFNEARGALAHLKRRWVDGAIVVTALKTFGGYRSFDAQVTIEDESPRPVLLTNLGVVKNVHFSGQMRYDIAQARNDGFFGVHLCEGMSRLEMVGTLVALAAGKFSGRPKTSSRQAKRVDIEAAQPFAVETDGEVLRTRHARFGLLARELFVCP